MYILLQSLFPLQFILEKLNIENYCNYKITYGFHVGVLSVPLAVVSNCPAFVWLSHVNGLLHPLIFPSILHVLLCTKESTNSHVTRKRSYEKREGQTVFPL